MKFDSLSDAQKNLFKYTDIEGVYYSPSKQRISQLFVGHLDPIWSAIIYRGILGNTEAHFFTKEDLKNIDFWAAFFDGSIVRLWEVLQDEYLKSLCEPDALYKEIEINDEWSNPIRIPKGLSFRMTFREDKEIWYNIYDVKNPEKSKKETMQRHEGFCRLFRYDNITELEEMEEPTIIFKLPDNKYNPSEISLLFVNE
jgi:hypothetical protein